VTAPTTVTVEYDCGCRYDIPTRIPAGGSALHHHAAVDTVADLADAQHDRECPDRRP
jgi:hypothetical protein